MLTRSVLLDALSASAPESKPSALPSILAPGCSLELLVGPRGIGKSRLAASLALAFASGSSPWPGAPPLPPRRTVYLSRERTTLDLAHFVASVARDSLTIPTDPSAWDRIFLGGTDDHYSRPLDSDWRSQIARECSASSDPAPAHHLRLAAALRPA